MRTPRTRRLVPLLAASLALGSCARSVGPTVPSDTWIGAMDSGLSNLFVCGAGAGFRMQNARISGLGTITWEGTSPPFVMRIRGSSGAPFTVDVDISTYVADGNCPPGRPVVPMRVRVQPRYAAQMSPAGCVVSSEVTYTTFEVQDAPPVWVVPIEAHLRGAVHLWLDDWAAAAAQVAPGNPPGPRPSPLGAGRCP